MGLPQFVDKRDYECFILNPLFDFIEISYWILPFFSRGPRPLLDSGMPSWPSGQ